MTLSHPHDLARVDRVLARDRWNVLRRFLLAPIHLYILGLLVYWALRVLVGERSIDGGGASWLRLLGGFVGMANSVMPGLLLPAVPLAVFALLLRGWRAFAVLLLNIAALVFLYGELFVPQAEPSNTVGTPFTLVSYNLHADTRADVIARQVGVIGAFNADLVLLQELTQTTADAFVEALGAEYPYRSLFPVGASVQGSGVFSRYPLSGESVWYEPTLISAQRVEATVGEQTLLLYNMHPMVPSLSPLAYSTMQRDSGIADLLARAGREDAALPLILAGDFNLNDQSPMYVNITASYRDSVREVGTGFNPSWPNLRAAFQNSSALFAYVPPLVRLDYVFHNRRVAALEARVHSDSGGSDHHPVFTRLTFVEPGASMP